MTVDELQVLITANTNELRKEINNANKSISGLQKSANKGTTGVSTAFKKLKAGIIALGIGKVIKDSITSGMDAIESDSLFETSLGKSADAVRSWSDEVSNTLGLNAVSMRKNTGVIYNMTSSMGVAEDSALKMSKGVSLLSEDMASFYNLDSEEAFNKLRAGLTGETEPLKALGILVDENTVKQVAYSEGIAENGAELTQQQKVMARYVAILKQTGNAQGDLARTINSPSNQLRQLKQQVTQLGLAFSNFLMPIVSAVLPYITAFARVVTQALTSLAKFMGLSNTNASSETQKISDNVGGLNSGMDNANKKAKKLKSTLAGFDEMNVLQDNSADSGGGTGGGATSGDTGFNLEEYNAHLDWVNSRTDEIAEKIKTVFAGVGEFLKSTWDTVWNSEPVQNFVGAIVAHGQFLWEFWSTLGLNLWENINTTWANISGNIGTYIGNMTTLWSTFWADIQAGIEKWGQPIIDGVTKLFNSIWMDAIDPALQFITKLWADFSGILVELWNEHGKPLVDNIGEFVTNIIALFQKIWDDVLEPIITPFLETLSWLWDKHIKGLVKNVGDFIGSLVNGVLEIWNKFIQPIVMYLMDKLAPAWSFLSSLVISVFGTIIGVVSDVVGGIIKTLRGVVDFIVGVFTGNWEKAWNGVKNIFTGLWDSVAGIFKGVINVVIDVINAIISGINKLHWSVPDWVPLIGGKEFGFSIPKIPKLARGGIIDSPTYAMIGEAGKEAVMPLERNTGWIDQLASKIAEKIGGGSGDIKLTVKLGEDTIFDKFIEYSRAKSFETNGEVVFA